MEPKIKVSLAKEAISREAATQAFELNKRNFSADATFHQISQNITILLITLEQGQLSGHLLPNDIDLLLDSSLKLRDYVNDLRNYISYNDDNGSN